MRRRERRATAAQSAAAAAATPLPPVRMMMGDVELGTGRVVERGQTSITMSVVTLTEDGKGHPAFADKEIPGEVKINTRINDAQTVVGGYEFHDNLRRNLAAEIQGHADTGNQQQFYSLLKAAYGLSQGSQFPVRSEDGTTRITGKTAILVRWADHYRNLLNRHTVVDDSILDEIPVLPTMVDLEEFPTLPEVQGALNSLKNNKAAGPDGVPGEILRCGGEALAQCLLSFVTASWESGCVPQQWKDADLVSIYKKKGDKADCNNSRGISLLSCAGKALTRILLLRLIKSVSEDVLPESQCGFRKDRSTIDMAFSWQGSYKRICTGVRQGCVIAPVIFNLFLAAVMLPAKKNINPQDCIDLTYRLDGSLFNLRRLKAPIGLASASFGRLSSRVFLNKDLATQTKVAIYKAVCLSILLYASETWTLCRPHIRSLERFHIRCLQRILGLKWWHKVPHVEIRRRANVDPMETILLQRQLRWTGHLIRLPPNRLPRQVLYGELTHGRRTVGGQYKRFKDKLEHCAADRSGWRNACTAGCQLYTRKLNELSEARRAKRHSEGREEGRHRRFPTVRLKQLKAHGGSCQEGGVFIAVRSDLVSTPNYDNSEAEVVWATIQQAEPLEATEQHPYLGVILSHDLKWSHHIASITSKANSTLGFLRRNIRGASKELDPGWSMQLQSGTHSNANTVKQTHYRPNSKQFRGAQPDGYTMTTDTPPVPHNLFTTWAGQHYNRAPMTYPWTFMPERALCHYTRLSPRVKTIFQQYRYEASYFNSRNRGLRRGPPGTYYNYNEDLLDVVRDTYPSGDDVNWMLTNQDNKGGGRGGLVRWTTEGLVEMFYRRNHQHKWKYNKNGMFRTDQQGKLVRPTGRPKLLLPVFEKREVNVGNLLDQKLPKCSTISELYAAQEHEYEVLRDDVTRNIAAPTIEQHPADVNNETGKKGLVLTPKQWAKLKALPLLGAIRDATCNDMPYY
ncbi:hypothetical protein Bbelb_291340 [Branchiostoma belcheri]|nr:hypothetical protein Bbelb_291340 [Branchiostoma belcheri]